MFLVELTLKATQRKIWNRLSRQSLGAYHFRAKTNPDGTRNHWSRPFCFRSDRDGTKTSKENAWKCSFPIPTRLTKELTQPRQNKVMNLFAHLTIEKFLYISQPFLSYPQLDITCFAAMWTTGALNLKKKISFSLFLLFISKLLILAWFQDG